MMESIKFIFILIIALYCLDILLVECNAKIKSIRTKNEENQEEEYTVFEPTSEWKPLRKDEAIPGGLHVRVNLATGQREAKLLDPDERNDDDVRDLTAIADETKQDDTYNSLTAKELKYYLRKIQGEKLLPDDDVERVKRKFRSYEELKEELANAESQVKTDVEILQQLLSNYKDLSEKKSSPLAEEFKEEFDQKELTILSNLADLVHQIDNAKNFVKIGLKDVVFASLNSTSSKVRYEAAKLLGTAVQSNPAAQIIAMDFGTVAILLRTLAIDSSYQVKSGALFALSCLIRRFPAAQKIFVQRGGLNTISKLFFSKSTDQIKLQMKILSFVNDILLEKKDTLLTLAEMRDKNVYSERTAFEIKEMVEKLNQYEDIRLEDGLKEGGWCVVFRDLFRSISYNLFLDSDRDISAANGYEPARPEHNSIHMLASIIVSLSPTCIDEFSTLQSITSDLFLNYSILVKIENDPDSLFAQLQSTLANLSDTLSKYNVKDEL